MLIYILALGAAVWILGLLQRVEELERELKMLQLTRTYIQKDGTIVTITLKKKGVPDELHTKSE